MSTLAATLTEKRGGAQAIATEPLAPEASPPLKRHKPIPFHDAPGPWICADPRDGAVVPAVFKTTAVAERLYDAVNALRVQGKRTKKLREEARLALVPFADWAQCTMHAYPSDDPESPVYVHMSMGGRNGAAANPGVVDWYCRLKEDLTLFTGLSAWRVYDGQPLIDDDTLRSLGAEPTPPPPPQIVVSVLASLPPGNVTHKFAMDASALPHHIFDRLSDRFGYPVDKICLVAMNEAGGTPIDPKSTIPSGELLGLNPGVRMTVTSGHRV